MFEDILLEKDKRIAFLEAQTFKLFDIIERLTKEATYYTSTAKGANPLKKPLIADDKSGAVREMTETEYQQHYYELQEMGIL